MLLVFNYLPDKTKDNTVIIGSLFSFIIVDQLLLSNLLKLYLKIKQSYINFTQYQLQFIIYFYLMGLVGYKLNL